MNLYGSPEFWPAVHSSGLKSRDQNYLEHHGVKGQKWGVITKEYEPVTVDHRRGIHRNAANYPQVKPSAAGSVRMRRNANAVQRTPTEQEQQRKEKIKKVAIYGAVSLAALAAIYGGYKYTKITKAQAYSGTLNKFLQSHPDTNVGNFSGRMTLRRGIDIAKYDSRNLRVARSANAALKRSGAAVSRSDAMWVYKARKVMDKAANTVFTGGRFRRALTNKRLQRLSNRALKILLQ